MRTLAESEAREAQLQLLRYQLNPHFLFNTLNAVNALITAERADEAAQMLVRLGRFLRYSLESGDQQLVKLCEEVTAAALYMEIEQVRFSDRLLIEFAVDASVQEIKVPSLLLQPLIENAIKYAIAKSEDGGTIRVTARPISRDDAGFDAVCITVEDSGIGERPSIDATESVRMGIGLKNTQARLVSLFGDNCALDVATSSLGGLCVSLIMPR
jgi:LytS/YehU family sensor histidine kinase